QSDSLAELPQCRQQACRRLAALRLGVGNARLTCVCINAQENARAVKTDDNA
ncbi:hypothetical protein J6590_096361, partial [Homalodisca vitripennis]